MNNEKQQGLISLLLDLQKKFNYLPEHELERIASEQNVPLTRLYSLATFYGAFSLKPKGKYVIKVCMGTACHVRGAGKLVDRLQQLLMVEPGKTTPDNNFTLETVNCVGTCAIGPVIVINDKYYGKMTSSKLEKVLEKYKKES